MREITVQVVLKLDENAPLRKGDLSHGRIETLMRSAAWLLVYDKNTETVSACVLMDREVE